MKVGVIGAGYWGPNLIRNFAQIEETDLVYVCDLDSNKLDKVHKTYPYVKVTKDYKTMFLEVDAVVIALPVRLHYKIAKDALEAGKHVLIEKPMTASVAEAEELIKIAKERNLVLMVDHTFEYSEPINKMKEIVQSGELGDMHYLRAEWLNLGLLQPDVNVIWDLATHISSIINYVFGMAPLRLNADVGAYIRAEIPEVAHMHIEYPKGVKAYCTVSWLEPRKTRTITIVGSKKMLVYDLTNSEEPIKIYDKGVDLTKVGDETQHRINYRYGDIYSPQVKNVEPLTTMCKHFAECVINGKVPRSDGVSGMNVVKILEASNTSIKEKREVKC